MGNMNISFSDVHIPINIKDFFHIEIVTNRDNYHRSPRYKQIDNSTPSQINSIIKYLPMLLADNQLSEAYRLVFPNGISSVLSIFNHGVFPALFSPEALQAMTKAIGFPFNNINLAYDLFSTLSVITNQYYLRQISQQLSDIQSKLDQVLDFLYSDKACEIYSETMAILGISSNYTSIMSCSEQRIASIQTIQHAKIVAERNIQFYYRDMNKLADKAGAADKLRDDLQNYTQAINLYGICTTLEIVLSQNYDEAYLDSVEADLKNHVAKHIGCVSNLQGKMEHLLKPTAQFPFVAPAKPDPKVERLLSDVSSVLGDNSPVKGFDSIIDQIRAVYTTKSEYIIESNGTIYQLRS